MSKPHIQPEQLTFSQYFHDVSAQMCIFLAHFGVFMTKCVRSCPNEYIFGEWFSVGYKGFTGSTMSVKSR